MKIYLDKVCYIVGDMSEVNFFIVFRDIFYKINENDIH